MKHPCSRTDGRPSLFTDLPFSLPLPVQADLPADCTNQPSEDRDLRVLCAQEDMVLCFLKVARSATERALRFSHCPDLVHLVACADSNLAAAHDLIQTDREQAA